MSLLTLLKNLFSTQDTGEPGWWRGEISGREGVFPDNFVIMHEVEKEVRSDNSLDHCRPL